MADQISVLLMDDHVVVREGLRALLERQDDVTVLAEAGSVAEAVAVEVQPDVVVADLVLPDDRGADVVKRLYERYPDSAILVLTMVDNPTDVQLCLAAGARGYLLKETASTELVDAVRKVAGGEDYLQPRSEEHTSELQSRQYLVCRLLLAKKKNQYHNIYMLPYVPHRR